MVFVLKCFCKNTHAFCVTISEIQCLERTGYSVSIHKNICTTVVSYGPYIYTGTVTVNISAASPMSKQH